MRVLYVTERWDAPYRYRCRAAIDQLRAEGVFANLRHLSDRALLDEVPRYGVVVLFRLPWSERVEAVIAAARKARLAVLFDIDDLIFDPSFAALLPFRRRYSARDWHASYGTTIAALSRTFSQCDAFIGSTPELAEQAALLGKPAHVHPNIAPELYLRLGRVTDRARPLVRSTPVIGYFSGSDTHDEDFRFIGPALRRVLAKKPETRLLVGGHLAFGRREADLARRTVRLPYMNWRHFAVAHAACDVVVAPLSLVNAFTNGKSALKFFEAGAFFTPLVATPVRELARAVRHGETGWLAETEEDWVGALLAALDPETSRRVGSAARRAVEASYSERAVRGNLWRILRGYARKASGPAPRIVDPRVRDDAGRVVPLAPINGARSAVRDVAAIVRAARAPRATNDGHAVDATEPADDPAVRRGVDIVVPVYGARDLVMRCIDSVVRHATGDTRLVIIDDASPDPLLLPELAAFAAKHDRVVLLSNPVNLGFVGTANRGMRHGGGRDVLLLNSDTEVFEGFVDGLRRAAYSARNVAMASPLSNNATICSVPDFCVENALPPEMTAAEMAALVSKVSDRSHPELVTPHGFCMYVRADLIAQIGVFDEERFGRGFGEENDFGERAREVGRTTVLADDVYVWHAGKASFGDLGHELEARHASVLSRRHPAFHPAVARFIAENPLAPVQSRIRRHLARRSDRVDPAPLFVLHANPFAASPGGVEYAVLDLVRALDVPRAVLLYPVDGALEAAEILDADVKGAVRYRFLLGSAPERFCHEHTEATLALGEVLDLFRIGWAHVHHAMFLPIGAFRLFRERKLPYLVTVHDFYPSCPSFNLLDRTTTTRCCPASKCDASQVLRCQRALFADLGERLPDDPVRFVDEHRRLFESLFDGAHRVVFPTASAAQITQNLLRIAPERIAVIPHGYDAAPVTARTTRRAGPLRVAFVGQVAYASKGSAAYLQLLELARNERVEWHVFGRTDLFGFDGALDAIARRGEGRVVRHGPYDRDAIVKRLVDLDIDVGMLLSPWPETFSYTLSELLAAKVPVIARADGAYLDRLRDAQYAILVEGEGDAAREVARLARNPPVLVAMARRIPELTSTYVASRAYAALHDEAARASPVLGAEPASAETMRRLDELGTTDSAPPSALVSITRPASHHVSSFWYPYAERLKPHVPESLRHFVRARLTNDRGRPIARFRLPGPRATLFHQLTLDRRYVATSRLTSHGTDPSILLDVVPFDPARVTHFRFNLWCSTPAPVFAQLYFRHAGEEKFDEAHSATVALDGRQGAWQEYVFRFDRQSGAKTTWYDGARIVGLRFDPINVPGLIGLGELALCE